MGIHFYAIVPQFSTVYFAFRQIWNSNFNMLRSLSRYHYNIKTAHIGFMLTKFHENQGPVTYFSNFLKHLVLIN